MNSDAKKWLLAAARKSIDMYLDNEEYKPDMPEYPELGEKSGIFVTLNKDDNLRGCIGFIMGVHPLFEAAAIMAREAAFHDPRFPSLTRKEFNKIEIEISVLTPLEKIEDYNDIEIGIHGLLMRNGFRSGLLLPQVATDWGYDKTQFLEQTCRKAGMQKECYKESETEIYRFRAEIFSEGDFE